MYPFQVYFTNLDLEFKMLLEVSQQCEKYGQGQLKHLRHWRHPILRQGHTQILFDGIDEHVIGLKNGASILQDGQQ